MQHIEKEVREYLRAGDILMARLKTEKALSAEEIRYLESYTARIRRLIKLCEVSETGKEPHITVRVSRDKLKPLP